jgi:hypothetical protein
MLLLGFVRLGGFKIDHAVLKINKKAKMLSDFFRLMLFIFVIIQKAKIVISLIIYNCRNRGLNN